MSKRPLWQRVLIIVATLAVTLVLPAVVAGLRHLLPRIPRVSAPESVDASVAIAGWDPRSMRISRSARGA